MVGGMERENQARTETPDMDDTPRLLSATKAALVLGCSSRTVRRLVAESRLDAVRLSGARGHWRITRASVDAFAEGKR
jgi:excisionase family DNA binding protein